MSRGSKRKTTANKAAATQSAPSHDLWRIFGVSIFLVAITWIVFGQTLQFQFVNFDDGQYIYKNPHVARGLTIDGFVWAFTHVHAANWHPLTWLSHMLDCQLYSLTPSGHHLTNIVLHTTNAILLFLVLRQMTGALWRSAFVAAVFAIHPLHVESVAWVAERKDVLSGLFFMLTIAAYIRYARRPWSPGRYGLVLLLFALGLMSKPMLVTLPFVLLLLDYWPLNRLAAAGDPDDKKFQIPRNLILEKLPLLALVAASCAATLFAQKVAIQPLTNISLMVRIGNAIISYVAYTRDMFWPSGLAASYPLAAGGVVLSKVLLSLLLLVVISVVVLVLRRRRYLVIGWLWYLIMLGPVIGILQVGNQARADRYTYLPHIGLYLLVTWLVVDLSARWRHRGFVLGLLSISILTPLLFCARIQASYWHDSERLWAHTLACTVDNTIAEQNLGEALHEQGKTDEAIARFQKALEINPNQASVHSSLAVALLEKGHPQESLAHLQSALAIDPRNEDAHYNMGNTLLALGRGSEAVSHYSRALELNPDDTEALNNLAWVLATWPEPMTRDAAKAIELAERADSLTGHRSSVVSATLAAAYAEAGRFADAVRTGERALQLATDEGNEARANSTRAQIKVYQSGAAFRDRRSSSVSH